MIPSDFALLFLSLGIAALSLLAYGWDGVGPAIIATAGGVWQLWLQWLRHRSWLRHRHLGFSPGTQHLASAAIYGWALAMIVGLIWAVVVFKTR